MDQLALRLIDFVSHENNPLGLAILALSALVEYVFPPFPGDTITLFGAFLITAKGWSLGSVFASVLFGSTLGSMLGFWLGRWIHRRQTTTPSTHPRWREASQRLVERFRRHGEVYIVLNRFLPGIRSLFFVAAGMAGMRPKLVLLWSVVSAALWNILLILVGSAVGANFESLNAVLMSYSHLAWLILALALGAGVVRAVLRWLATRRSLNQ